MLTYDLSLLNLEKMPNLEAAKKRIRKKRQYDLMDVEDIEAEDEN